MTGSESRRYSHLYGPVPSRRLGTSLGVDIVPYKVCSYDCVYCTLGRTTRLTSVPERLVDAAGVIREIKHWVKRGGKADYITFAGSGEPTLNTELKEMITATKSLTDIPVAVITNGSLLFHRDAYEALILADLLVPSIDAATEDAFRLINRPVEGMDLMDVTSGLQWMAQGFDGEIWLEVMLVRGINDSEDEMRAIERIARDIHPDKIQINTVVRPPGTGDARAVDSETLAKACRMFGARAEVIADIAPDSGGKASGEQGEQAVLDMLRRRPCTMDDIAAAFGMHTHEVAKHIGSLATKGLIEAAGDARRYYRPTGPVDGGKNGS